MLGPMTSQGDRGIYARIRIEDPFSLSLVRHDIYGYESEQIAAALEMGLTAGHMPKPRLRLRWSPEYEIWMSEFDLLL